MEEGIDSKQNVKNTHDKAEDPHLGLNDFSDPDRVDDGNDTLSKDPAGSHVQNNSVGKYDEVREEQHQDTEDHAEDAEHKAQTESLARDTADDTDDSVDHRKDHNEDVELKSCVQRSNHTANTEDGHQYSEND